MSICQIRLNENGFCCEYTVHDELLGSDWIAITRDLYPSDAGQKFDKEQMKWVNEFDESLFRPELPLSEDEKIKYENYSNILYLTAMADLGM